MGTKIRRPLRGLLDPCGKKVQGLNRKVRQESAMDAKIGIGIPVRTLHYLSEPCV